MKKNIIIFTSFIFLFLCFSCSRDDSGIKHNYDGSIELVMAEVDPITSVSGRTDLVFRNKVEELSGGKIKINLLTNGLLGSEDSVLDLMQSRSSSIQIARVSTASLTFRGIKKSVLLTLPYTFRNYEHFWNFTKSEFAEEFLSETEDLDLGLKGLYFGTEGFRSFFSTVPLETPEDFKNYKIRITTDPVLIKLVRALKAEPVFFNTNDLYVVLQTGKVEVAEQPIVNYYVNSLYDVAPYFLLDEHTLGVTEVLITEKAWNALNSKQQKILEEAGEFASEYCRQILEEAEKFSFEGIKIHGAKITEPKDNLIWKEYTKNIVCEYAKDCLSLYEKILAIE